MNGLALGSSLNVRRDADGGSSDFIRNRSRWSNDKLGSNERRIRHDGRSTCLSTLSLDPKIVGAGRLLPDFRKFVSFMVILGHRLGSQ